MTTEKDRQIYIHTERERERGRERKQFRKGQEFMCIYLEMGDFSINSTDSGVSYT